MERRKPVAEFVDTLRLRIVGMHSRFRTPSIEMRKQPSCVTKGRCSRSIALTNCRAQSARIVLAENLIEIHFAIRSNNHYRIYLRRSGACREPHVDVRLASLERVYV